MIGGVWRWIDVGEGAEAFADGFDAFGGAFDLREGVDGESPVAEVQPYGDVVEVGVNGDELDAASEVSEWRSDDVFAGYAF